jgi:cytochrome c peroxidase
VKKGLFLILIGISVILSNCTKQETEIVRIDRELKLDLPEGFPEPVIPDDNQLTETRVELGRILFFDTRLSRDMSVSCASCQVQDLAFADGNTKSIGIEGRIGDRNSPTLANSAYLDRLFLDGGVPSLELQVLAPIKNENEMDFDILEAIDRLSGDDEIQELSNIAYDRDIDPFVVTRAIASYERTMISGNSSFDKYFFQEDNTALNELELLGWELFNNDITHCSDCHSGFNFTNNSFENIGLYEVYSDPGRERISFDPGDNGKFRVPTLRNVERTGPYMHDGSLETLEEVVGFFN